MPGLAGCTYNIRKDLAPSFATGGTWKYIGFNASSGSGPWTSTPANPLVNYTANSTIPLGDDFVIETKDKTVGYYKFTYTVLASTVDLIVRIIDGVITAGVSKTLDLTPSSGNTNLLTALGATAGGTWTDIDNVGAAFSNGILDPSGLAAGEYEFKYDLTGTYVDEGCDSCPPLVSTITVKIAQSLKAIITATDDTCAFTISGKHPDTSTANSGKVEIATDGYAPTIKVNKVITSCTGVVYTATENIASFDFVYVGVTSTSNNVFQAGANLETVTLTDSVTQTTTTIGVAPSGTNIATFSGVGGNITANSLIYNGVDFNSFIGSVSIAIQNRLGVLGFTQGIHYVLRIAGSITGLRIQMAAKHNPTTKWFGVTGLSYKTTSSGQVLTETIPVKDVSFGGNTLYYSTNPCPSDLRLRYMLENNPVDLANTSYNTIGVITPIALTVASVGSKLTETCNSKLLQTTVQNCNGTVTYSWSSGETTQSIEKVTRGTYTVTVTCSNPSGTTTAQYVY
jgi:hypothetical protein